MYELFMGRFIDEVTSLHSNHPLPTSQSIPVHNHNKQCLALCPTWRGLRAPSGASFCPLGENPATGSSTQADDTGMGPAHLSSSSLGMELHSPPQCGLGPHTGYVSVQDYVNLQAGPNGKSRVRSLTPAPLSLLRDLRGRFWVGNGGSGLWD